MADLKKPVIERAKCLESVTFAVPDDAEGLKAYPNLYDLLTPRWKEGSVTRQAGRLSIKADGSGWRASIECPTEGLQTTMVASSLETVMLELEDFIASGKAHWALSWSRQKKNLPTLDTAIQ